MRKLTLNMFLTLDGVMQAPGGPNEDTDGGFRHGGWSVNYWDETMGEIIVDAMSRPYDLILGRRTYEIFAAHWPNVSDDDPVAAGLNSATKHVASRTLKNLDWANSTLINGDAAEYVTRLKDQTGPDLQVHGSGQLVQTLLSHDLIDEFRLWFFPVVFGEGKRLFADGTVPAALRLVDSRTSSTSVLINTYERSGAIQFGSYAVDEQGETSKLWTAAHTG